MIRIALAARVARDFERILEHLASNEAADARVETIIAALEILLSSPFIGRPARQGRRELIVGRRTRGYVVLYRYRAKDELVEVLAIRAQRELGYRR